MPYRHDEAALEDRRTELLAKLEEATRRIEALGLTTEERAKARLELTELEAQLRRARGVSLPLLESLTIASPCSADWGAMKGDDRVRFCGSCEKNVYNLSAMPRAEAEALLVEREGNVCVRFFRRTDGTVLSGDCPVGVQKKRRRRLVLAVASAGAFAAAGAATFLSLHRPAAKPGCELFGGTTTSEMGEPPPMMGAPVAIEQPAVASTSTPAVMGSAPPVERMGQMAPPPPAVMGMPPTKRPVLTMGAPHFHPPTAPTTPTAPTAKPREPEMGSF